MTVTRGRRADRFLRVAGVLALVGVFAALGLLKLQANENGARWAKMCRVSSGVIAYMNDGVVRVRASKTLTPSQKTEAVKQYKRLVAVYTVSGCPTTSIPKPAVRSAK